MEENLGTGNTASVCSTAGACSTAGVCSTAGACSATGTAKAAGRPLIGVNDYDAFLGFIQAALDLNSLTPEKWEHRLPYYAEVTYDAGRLAKDSGDPAGFAYRLDGQITGIMIYAAYDPAAAFDEDDDIQIFLSPDGIDYTRYASDKNVVINPRDGETWHMPQANIIHGTEAGWTKVNYWGFKFTGNDDYLLPGAKYVKIVINKAGPCNPQIMRVEITYETEDYPYARFVDDLDDFSLMHSHDGSLVIKSDSPEDFRLVTGISDTQQAVDEQIIYAKNAGIDYFQIDDLSHGAMAKRKVELIRSSRYKDDIKYCIMSLGPDYAYEPWLDRINRYIGYFKDDNYVKVCGGRPLFYLHTVSEWKGAEISLLREKAKEAGLPDPYIAGIYSLDCDVYCDAGCFVGGGNPRLHIQPSGRNHQTIPAISFGFNEMPRVSNPPLFGCGKQDAPMLNPDEIEEFINECLAWYDSNRNSVEAETMLIYAWNEHTECATCLCPTRGADGKPNTASLDAVGKALASYNYKHAVSRYGARYHPSKEE